MQKVAFIALLLALVAYSRDVYEPLDYESRSIILEHIKKKYEAKSLPNRLIDTRGGIGNYHFVVFNTYTTDYEGRNSSSEACFDIFDSDLNNTQGFCFRDDYIAYISSVDINGAFGALDSNFTFKLIKDKFYLYEYKKHKQENDFIYYRQPRDDPKMTNLIPLESITDELLETLQDECKKSGKCTYRQMRESSRIS